MTDDQYDILAPVKRKKSLRFKFKRAQERVSTSYCTKIKPGIKARASAGKAKASAWWQTTGKKHATKAWKQVTKKKSTKKRKGSKKGRKCVKFARR